MTLPQDYEPLLFDYLPKSQHDGLRLMKMNVKFFIKTHLILESSEFGIRNQWSPET